MRLLFVSTDFPYAVEEGEIVVGGGGACVAQMANALDKKGYAVEVVTRKEEKSKGELYDFPIYRTKFYELPIMKRESKITHYFPATKKCKKLLSKSDFDLIHTHNPTAGMTGCRCSKKFKLPHVMTLHGPWATVRQKAYTRAIARIIEGKTVRCADTVTCDSSALRDEVIEEYDPPEDKIVAIPNAVETDVFKPGESQKNAKDELGIKTDKPVILYTGRFVEEKGLPYLLEAFKEISGAHLLLLGGGFDEHLVLEWLSENKSFKDQITVIPFLPYAKMPQAYSACDVFVLPTLAEGMSRSIMEAMSCGKPVVATDVGGNPELVSEKTGALVESKEPKGLASEIQKIIDDPKLVSKKGKAARNFAVKNLSVEKRINSIISVYGRIMEKK